MKKLKSLLKTYGARIGALVMCFVLLIPMLCSMASPSGEFELTIQNPDNIPHDYSIGYYTTEGGMDEEEKPLDFGVNSVYGLLTNGTIDGEQLVPLGNYAMIYVVGVNVNGGTALTCNGTLYVYDVFNCYVTDNPVITVTDDYSEEDVAFFVFVPIDSPTTITSVWSGILNWMISSLGSVQGVFINSGIYYYVNEYPEFTFSYDGNSYGSIDYDEFFSYRYLWYDGNRIDSLSELTQIVITINGYQFGAYSYDGTVLAFSDGSNYWAIDNGLLGVSNSAEPSSLTLLGTLSVIGLSIAVVFLLIGIIQRFLKLRG